MSVYTQTVKVDLKTVGVMPKAYIHQNDSGRQLVFEVYNNNVAISLSGFTAKFGYVSPKVNGQYTVISGSGMATGAVSDNTVTVTLPSTYTQVAGVGLLTMILTESSGTIRPVNIALIVQRSADGADTIAGASDFPQTIFDYVEEELASVGVATVAETQEYLGL